MAVHHGGKVGAAGKTLANHKHKKHYVVVCYRELYGNLKRYRTKNSGYRFFCNLSVSR